MDLDKINVEKELRILFMGTPSFSVPILEGLLDNYKIRAVVTQPDRIIGRDNVPQPTPVKKLAMENTILVLQPEKIRNEYQEIISLKPDLIITCAYGQILPKELLEVPKLGCINVHASLLPKLRGGAPIHHAIIDGYTKTGITIMYMNEKMDEGDIISQKEMEISPTETASSLHDKLSLLGKELLLETLPSIIAGTNGRIPQDHSKATYGLNIKRKDEKIDFNKSKKQIYNQVRGLNSWPGAYCFLEGKIFKVWECVETNNTFPTKMIGEITGLYDNGIGVKVFNGEIVFTVVQPEGKQKMSAIDYLNGIADKENFKNRMFN